MCSKNLVSLLNEKQRSTFANFLHLFYQCPLLTYSALVRGSHGLSARRARRTRSMMPEGQKAGPKGRQLEVGAQRAPRLLVCYIFEKLMLRGCQNQCLEGSQMKIYQYKNTQIHKYTNTVWTECEDRHDMCYIFEKLMSKSMFRRVSHENLKI